MEAWRTNALTKGDQRLGTGGAPYAARCFVRRLPANPAKTTPRKYNPNSGTINRAMLTGSGVGVMTAAATAITTTATFQPRSIVRASTRPSVARANISKGNSKATPTQNMTVVANWM